MKLLKLFWAVLRDEEGIAPLIAEAAILLGGSTLLGSLFGKKKKNEEIYDPYADLREKYKGWLTGKLGTSTPYEDNPAFNLEQPAVEKATESTILGKLNTPETYKGYSSDITNQLYSARKARLGESFTDEMNKTKDMYNRLGLVSSTPGLTAQQDVAESQRLAEDDLSAQLMYEDITRELEAKKLADESLQGWTSQGQALGGAQRGYEEYAQQMSVADLERLLNEEMGYGREAGSILGSNPPERTVSYTPNIWAQLAQTGQNIGSTMLKKYLLGGK